MEQMERVGLLGVGGRAHRPGLALLHEVTGVALDLERTTLALAGKLPTEGFGPEKATADKNASGAAAPIGTGGLGALWAGRWVSLVYCGKPARRRHLAGAGLLARKRTGRRPGIYRADGCVCGLLIVSECAP
ncbi:hypothetical protein Srufu_076660 [Streptomyces libani subsp. rufus]|nr:hypothetical protein Srufu_076660 [Streptomyces libani subsp. rufus]